MLHISKLVSYALCLYTSPPPQDDGYVNFSIQNMLEGKRRCKAALQKELGLPQVGARGGAAVHGPRLGWMQWAAGLGRLSP